MNNEIKKATKDTEVIGNIKLKDEISWSDVLETHKDMSDKLVGLQMMIVQMVKQNEQAIDNDPKLYAVVTGLMKTVDDVAKELKEIYMTFGHKGNGLVAVDNESDVKLYLKASQEYILVTEKLLNLSSTAITDVLTMINLNNDTLLKESIKLKDEIIEKSAEHHGIDTKEL